MGLTLLDFELMEGPTDATIPSLVTHYEVSSNVHKEEERAACLSILLGTRGERVVDRSHWSGGTERSTGVSSAVTE